MQSSEDLSSNPGDSSGFWLLFAAVFLLTDCLGINQYRIALDPENARIAYISTQFSYSEIPYIVLCIFFAFLMLWQIVHTQNLLQRSFFAFYLIHLIFDLANQVPSIARMYHEQLIAHIIAACLGAVFICIYRIGVKQEIDASSESSS